MNGISMKGFGVRSFMINGLTAKWGIGENRVPPIWDANLIGRWDARGLPDGALATIPNTATMADKAPDLIVTGATMADGTLQFDGVDDGAVTSSFLLPKKYTIFWDIDWLGDKNKSAGIIHGAKLLMYNSVSNNRINCYINQTSSSSPIPNTSVALSTSGEYYSRGGIAADLTGAIGDTAGNGQLSIAKNGTTYTRLGFRQLLIFNKELTQAEVNNVLTTMFTP